MRRFLFVILFFQSLIYASQNVLVPNVQINLTPTMGDYGAFSFMGELGEKNFRGSGTYGVNFTSCQRVKFSGEFLTQKLNYHFFPHREKKWTSQYAVGGEYQYL